MCLADPQTGTVDPQGGAANRMTYRLRSTSLLAQLMEHPGRGNAYSLRELASNVSRGKSWMGKLRHGRVAEMPEHIARQIAETLGVDLLVLFMPCPSMNVDDSGSNGDGSNDTCGTLSENADGRAQIVGEHG